MTIDFENSSPSKQLLTKTVQGGVKQVDMQKYEFEGRNLSIFFLIRHFLIIRFPTEKKDNF